MTSQAAQDLFSIEPPNIEHEILSHAGPRLNTAIHKPYVKGFVLAQAHAEVVSEQTNEIKINLARSCPIIARKIRAHNEPDNIVSWEESDPVKSVVVYFHQLKSPWTYSIRSR